MSSIKKNKKLNVETLITIISDLENKSLKVSNKIILETLKKEYQLDINNLDKDEYNQKLSMALKIYKKNKDSNHVSVSDIKNSDHHKSLKKSTFNNEKDNFNNLINPEFWVLPNRRKFINWIDSTFLNYKAKGYNESSNQKYELFSYQQFIRDYIQFNSPYRGLLLYHGLGSGKTCSSIAVAESMKGKLPSKSVIIMLPASLEPNYIDELMKCGSDNYKLQQHWTKYEGYNSFSLSNNIISKNGGIWFNDPKKKSNYHELSELEKLEIKLQLKAIISNQFTFIHYNGLRSSNLDTWTSNNTNYFSNKLIIIDEVHNLISMIVGGGKIGKRLYHILMEAENSRFILLSGTPIINYPYEAAYLFNLLRGSMKLYKIKLQFPPNGTDEEVKKYLTTLPYIDIVENDINKTVNISINDSYFQNFYQDNNYQGVKKILSTKNQINEKNFISVLKEDLKLKNYFIKDISLPPKEYFAFPEKQDVFDNLFLKSDNSGLKNHDLFKRRILGTVSYYKGAKAHLLPEKIGPHIIECIMSPHQSLIYKQIRSIERDKERISKSKNKNKKKDDDNKISSYYRVFSRATCNFVFPEKIERPFPSGKNQSINEEDEGDVNESNFNNDDFKDALKKKNQIYEKQKIEAFNQLDKDKDKYLNLDKLGEYSEKYKQIILNLNKSPGSAFIYSQFRSLEGIGILSLALLANGYAEYKLEFNSSKNEWVENIDPQDEEKPKFAFYSGTEEPEYKDVIKKIFNNDLQTLSPKLRKNIEKKGSNLRGNVIKVLLATASAAEGITLANVRQVHIMEPYWNPVRIQQVIGRAVRIKSHFGNEKFSLKENERNVEIYIYISSFDKKYFQEDYSWLRLDNFQTSDQKVYEIASNKQKITDGLFTLMKEASVDCELNSQDNENIDCFSFGNISSDNQEYSYYPNIDYDNRIPTKKVEEKSYNFEAFEFKGKLYYLNRDTYDIYDYNSVIENKGRKIKIGKIDNGRLIFFNDN